jgi:tetratricopeptide (TPR) repeat protein
MMTLSRNRSSLSNPRNTRLHVILFFLLALGSSICGSGAGAAWGQTSSSQIASFEARIHQYLEFIRIAEQEHLPKAKQGDLQAQLAVIYQEATEFQKAEDAYYRALPLLKTAPSYQAEYAETFDSLGSLYLYTGRVDDAEKARKAALAVRKKLGDRSGMAVSQVHLADIALKRHQFKKAEQLALKGKEGMEISGNPPEVGLLSAFITLTYARCSRGHCDQGLVDAQQAVAFAKKHFAPQTPAVGFALQTLGFAEWKNGATRDGEQAMLQGIEILRARLVPADPRMLGAMLQYRAYLVEANRPAEAQEIQKQVARTNSQAGISCPGCTVSVSSFSNGLR